MSSTSIGSSTALPPSCSSPMEKASLGNGLSDTAGHREIPFKWRPQLCHSRFDRLPTFLQRRTGGEGRPLSDGGVPLVASALLSLAATQKDVSAVEAQVAVGFAAAALAAHLQPQEAAVATLLKVKQRVLARFFYLWTFSCRHQTFPSAFIV